MHGSGLINQVRSGSDLDCYLGQRVIWVSDADPVSTLVSAYSYVPSYSEYF